MNRIEEIKERYKPGTAIKYKNEMELASIFQQDARELISRLEIAEKALEKVSKNGKQDFGEDSENVLIICGDIADEALQQIRS